MGFAQDRFPHAAAEASVKHHLAGTYGIVYRAEDLREDAAVTSVGGGGRLVALKRVRAELAPVGVSITGIV